MGSRTFWDVLRHPFSTAAHLLGPVADVDDSDRRAAWGLEGVLVFCFLKAMEDPFPKYWKPGYLHLDAMGVRWRQGYRCRGGGDVLRLLHISTVRDVDQRTDRWLKPGLFRIIEGRSPMGHLSLAVPAGSVRLVVDRLVGVDEAG